MGVYRIIVMQIISLGRMCQCSYEPERRRHRETVREIIAKHSLDMHTCTPSVVRETRTCVRPQPIRVSTSEHVFRNQLARFVKVMIVSKFLITHGHCIKDIWTQRKCGLLLSFLLCKHDEIITCDL